MFTKPSKYAIMSTQQRLKNREASQSDTQSSVRGLLERSMPASKKQDNAFDLSTVDDMVLRIRKAFDNA